MRHIIFMLGLLPFFFLAANAQPATTQTAFVGTCQFSGFTASGSNVVGTLANFSDQTNLYFANDIEVGDVAWDNLGTRWEIVAITSSNLVQAVVEMRNVNGTGGLPFGQGFVSRETPNLGLSMLPPDNATGISPQLKSRVEGHNVLLLDSLAKDGNGIYTGNGTLPVGGTIVTMPDAASLFNVQGNSSGGPLITYRGVNVGTAPTRIDIQNIRPGNGGQSNVFLSTNELNKNILGLYEGEKAFRIGVGAGDATTINPLLNFLELSAQGFNSGGPPNNFVRLRISGNGVVFSDSRGNDISYATPGIQYAADYSSSYTSRSLPDKNYVDTRLGGRPLFNTPNPTQGQYYAFNAAQNRFELFNAPSGTTNLSLSGAGPISLNSSTGTGISFLAGTNVTLTQSSNTLTINATGTDLTYTGAGPFTLNSSTGTDVTNSEGLGIDITRTGNDLNFRVDTAVIATQQYVDNAVSGVATNLTFSGSTTPSFGPITLENSAGTDVTFSSSGIISLQRSGNNLLISSTATPSAENIYNSNGSINSGTNRVVNILGSATLNMTRADDGFGLRVSSQGVRIGGIAAGAGVLATNVGADVSAQSGNAVVGIIAANANKVSLTTAPTTANWSFTLPANDGDPAQVLTTDGNGNTSWTTATGTDLTYTGAGPFTLNSSTGTDVTNSEGLGIDITRTGNDLNFRVDTAVIATQQYVDDAIADIPTPAGTNLSYTVLSGGARARINSSTGSPFTLNGETTGVSFFDDAGELAISAPNTNLAFSGELSPVILTSSTGTDVTFVAGTNITLSQSGNALTINATGGGGGGVVSGIATANTGVGNNIATVAVSAGSGAKPAVVTSTGSSPIFLTASYASGTLTVRAWNAAGSPLTESTLTFSYIIGGQ